MRPQERCASLVRLKRLARASERADAGSGMELHAAGGTKLHRCLRSIDYRWSPETQKRSLTVVAKLGVEVARCVAGKWLCLLAGASRAETQPAWASFWLTGTQQRP